MAKKKEEKTNVMRVLEQKGIPFTPHTYPHEDGVAVDGVTVARSMGQDPECVFKTLVARGERTGINVFCIPVCFELDLKKAAKAAGDKNMELIHVKELLGLTGYIRGGCSPIGMKKSFPTYIHSTCRLYDSIYVSAGVRGLQIRIAPDDLIRTTDASVVDLTV
mgnify:CR=1 FL=1